MQMPEFSVNTYRMRSTPHGEVRGYEHVVTVLLPWRRYNPQAFPVPCVDSPSRFELGEETRHGAELAVSRLSSDSILTPDTLGEMAGELAEAWVCLTIQPVKQL
jgi:hypothetical protein